jgi:glycosyltransferase involved in cell wall biosynthesis
VRHRVSIIYRFLPKYRLDFFCRLKDELAANGIELELIYGKNQASLKQDEGDLDWATAVRNREWRVGGSKFCWQPLPKSIHKSDLLVLMQETKILSNYLVLAQAAMRGQKVAFWGHGLNFQAHRGSTANRLKRAYSTRVDWWFAYTHRVAEILAGWGFPRKRITVVQNAIDTRSLTRAARELPASAVNDLRNRLGIGKGPVGLFCGGMYPEKRLGFLLDACQQIRSQAPTFEVIFIGAGPDRHIVEEFSSRESWVHYVGPKFGDARVPYFKLADVFLMPGLVGLAVLDCFALELPLVTTDYPYHSPEIDYVENGRNAIISENRLDSYVEAVLKVIHSQSVRNRLREGCAEGAVKYTVERMVANFIEGVGGALNLKVTTRPRAISAEVSS